MDDGSDGRRRRQDGSPAGSDDDGAQPRPGRHLGPRHRLPDDEPERPRLHEPVPLREARRRQGPRLLRRRRDRHGPLLGPDRRRGQGEDRLPARPGLGRADDGAVGLPRRSCAGEAPAPHRRLDRRDDRGRVGPGHGGPPGRRSGRGLRGAARADRPPADQPARDAQAAGEPGPLLTGPARHPGDGDLLRRDRPPHAGGLRLPAGAPPRRVSARPCGSATSRSATTGSTASRSAASSSATRRHARARARRRTGQRSGARRPPRSRRPIRGRARPAGRAG